MHVLDFWHTAPDYTERKRVFDSDPLGREASGVRRYTLMRPASDEHTVTGHLLFDRLHEAETFAGRLREVWNGLGRDVVANAALTITEVLEEKACRHGVQRQAA